MTVGVHPKLKLCPCNESAVKGQKTSVSVFYSWMFVYQTNRGGTLLLPLQLCFCFIYSLPQNYNSVTLPLFYEEMLLLCSRATMTTQRAVYAVFCPKPLSEATQSSSALQRIWEVILLMTWLKAECLWVTKVSSQGMILWSKWAGLVLKTRICLLWPKSKWKLDAYIFICCME